MDATVSAGRESDENPTYATKFEVTGSGPVDILSLKVEGTFLGFVQTSCKTALNQFVILKTQHTNIHTNKCRLNIQCIQNVYTL